MRTKHATNEQMAEIMEWKPKDCMIFRAGKCNGQKRIRCGACGAFGHGNCYGNGSGAIDVPCCEDQPDWCGNLNHAALVEARLAELGLKSDYVLNLLSRYPGETIDVGTPIRVAADFIDLYFWQITVDAQTRCDAAWATWQQYQEQAR